jgi:hypothetical protein
MKIILTENQHSSLKNNLMEVINRFGIDAGIKAVGSFNTLLKIIGKESLYDVLIQHGFDPVFKIVTSRFEVPRELYYLKIYSSLSGFLNHWGPMFLFTIDNKDYLYQDQNGLKIFIGEYDDLIDDPDQDGIIDEDIFQDLILKPLGLKGLNIGKVIDLYYTEED